MAMLHPSPLPQELEHLSEKVIGCAIRVHSKLGPGFLESIYEKALCYELDRNGILYERQKEILVEYEGIMIDGQRLDLVVENQMVVELKTIESFLPIHQAQVLSYLKTTGLRLGLLINFNVHLLKNGLKRVIL